MTEALADIFAAARSHQIDWGGAPAYEITSASKKMTVEFLSATGSPVQEFTLKAGGGLVVNDIEATKILLWRDTAPDSVYVQVKPQEKRRR